MAYVSVCNCMAVHKMSNTSTKDDLYYIYKYRCQSNLRNSTNLGSNFKKEKLNHQRIVKALYQPHKHSILFLPLQTIFKVVYHVMFCQS